MEITKQDWSLFRNKIAAWQESYMLIYGAHLYQAMNRASNRKAYWSVIQTLKKKYVLVNDPTTGYGIFIENMLDAAA